jgi:hypothetical protein
MSSNVRVDFASIRSCGWPFAPLFSLAPPPFTPFKFSPLLQRVSISGLNENISDEDFFRFDYMK